MKKSIFTLLFLSMLSACSTNSKNYYLNSLDFKEDIQKQPTAEVTFNNVVYAKILDKKTSSKLFNSDLNDNTVIFFKAKNTGNEVTFFNLKKSTISIGDEEFKTPRINIADLTTTHEVDLNTTEFYTNPFYESEMEDNNFTYNLNNKVLNDFSLKPNETKSGFIIFEKNKKAEKLNFFITTGSSIYTAREQQINLDK